MRKNKLLPISLSLIIAAGGIITGISNFNTQPKYKAQTFKSSHRDANGAGAYLKLIRADPKTGEVDPLMVLEAKEATYRAAAERGGLSLVWEEMGPDNVGGRTRSFIIDKDDDKKLWAGSVGGGLFYSVNGGGTWFPYANPDAPMDMLPIGCMVQSSNGDLYIGTGEGMSYNPGTNASTPGFDGDGIFKSIDRGVSFQRIPSTKITKPAILPSHTRFQFVNQLAMDTVDPNKIWAATGRGLNVSYDGGTTWKRVLSGSDTSAKSTDVDVSKDGQVVVASVNNRCWVSTDGGTTFTKKSGPGTNEIANDVSRLEFAIAPSNSNYVYCSAADGASKLKNIYVSIDKGVNWSIIGRGGFSNFEPFVSASGQGAYDNAISVDPFDEKHIILGGVELWEFRMTSIFPPSGGWAEIAHTNEYPGATQYVHADKHWIRFNPKVKGTYYVCSDGGVSRTKDGGKTFGAINRGYNVTQFYAIAMATNDMVMGGTQDNGTQLIGFGGNTKKSAIEVGGGDGGDCAFSHFAPVGFSTVYNGSVSRFKEGAGGGGFFDATVTQEDIEKTSFVTPINLWENPAAPVPMPFGSTLPADTNTCFAFGSYSGIYITRQALDFSKTPKWYKIGDIGGTVTSCMAFSGDGNHLYVATENSGEVFRLSNLRLAKDSATTNTTVITQQRVFTAAEFVTDIAVDPNDPDNVIVTVGQYTNGTKVFRSSNATSTLTTGAGKPTFTAIHGNLPKAPVYSAVIDMTDNSKVYLGTETGVWSSDNAFAADPSAVKWYPENSVIGNVPVFMIRQQTLPPNKTNFTGYIYAGTHGKGIWKSGSQKVLGVENGSKHLAVKTSVYPNPAKEFTTVSFSLAKTSNVNIKVFSLDGKEVISNQLNRTVGNHTFLLDLSELETGTYLVQVQNQDMNEVKKIVKTR